MSKMIRDCVMRKFENVQLPEGQTSWPKGVLGVIQGPCMEIEHVNENNRWYPRNLIIHRILEDPDTQHLLNNRALLVEGCHPEDRFNPIYPETAGLVERLWIPEDDPDHLWGRFLVLDTPNGRIIKTLLDVGSSIGVSARAMGNSVPTKDGYEEMLEEDYIFYTFDFVPDPGFKTARPAAVCESKKSAIAEGIPSMNESELLTTKSLLENLNKDFFAEELRQVNEALAKTSSGSLLEQSQRRIADLEKALEESGERESVYDKVKPVRIPKSILVAVKDLQGAVTDAKKETEKAREASDRLERELDASRRENDDLRDTLDKKDEEIDQLKQKISDTRSQGSAFESKVRGIVKKSGEKDVKIKSLSKALESSRAKEAEATSQLSSLKKQLYESQMCEISARTGIAVGRVRALVPEVNESVDVIVRRLSRQAKFENSTSPVVSVVVESAGDDAQLQGLIRSQNTGIY